MKALSILALGLVLVLLFAVPALAQDAPPTPGDDDALKNGLLWLFGGGGAGVVAYAALGKIKAFEDLTPEYKRYISLVVTMLFAVVAYLAAAQLNYVESPDTAQGWLEKLAAIAFASTATAQAIHGARQLRTD